MIVNSMWCLRGHRTEVVFAEPLRSNIDQGNVIAAIDLCPIPDNNGIACGARRVWKRTRDGKGHEHTGEGAA